MENWMTEFEVCTSQNCFNQVNHAVSTRASRCTLSMLYDSDAAKKLSALGPQHIRFAQLVQLKFLSQKS
jgi:hypothetical protein